MEDYQDHGIKNLSIEIRPRILYPNFFSGCHLGSGSGRRSGIHDTCRFFKHHGCWSRSENHSRPVGSSQEYHPGLVYYHPCLRSDGGIKFLGDSLVAFTYLSSISIRLRAIQGAMPVGEGETWLRRDVDQMTGADVASKQKAKTDK